MFRKFDIVGVPDGRSGLVDQTYQPKKGVVVRFGPDGPVEVFQRKLIRFVSNEDLQRSGGVDFYRTLHIRVDDGRLEGVSSAGEGVTVTTSDVVGTQAPEADAAHG